MEQAHLSYKDRVNLGSYYTKPEIVKCVYDIIQKNITDPAQYTILDTSCGYGSFLSQSKSFKRSIGADIDPLAIEKASELNSSSEFHVQNSLSAVSRRSLRIRDNEKIIIIGNPPYNDTTSIIRNAIKKGLPNIDDDIRTRDIGISFLLSYAKLQASFICVLHPLSYLIKKSNFSLLKNFAKRYTLIDSLVISSNEFLETSKTTQFPIIIALYQKTSYGMDYPFIQNTLFKPQAGECFRISDFDTISNYVQKYPNAKKFDTTRAIAKFWTLRDINALKRSRTFITSNTTNTVFIPAEQLDYYCYIDVFKHFTKHIPYYFGNCDIIIDNGKFLPIREDFRNISLNKYPYLKRAIHSSTPEEASYNRVSNYFKSLLGKHYVY